MTSNASTGRRIRSGIAPLIAVILAAATYGVFHPKPTQHSTTLPPVATDTTPAPKPTFSGQRRIDACALLPIKTVNQVAPDLPVNADHSLSSQEDDPTKADKYTDACEYYSAGPGTGGHGASLIVHGYATGDTAYQTMVDGFNKAMTVLGSAQSGKMSKSNFYANGDKNKELGLQNQTVFTDPLNASKPVGLDVFFVYNSGATSYLVELNSDSWTEHVQDLITKVTDALPDLTKTDTNMGGDGRQI